MNAWLLLLPVALLSLALTAAIRRYALARSLMDVPNERSSHKVPTPRGGGLAIVLCFLGAIPFLNGYFGLAGNQAIALAGAGIVVAAIGFLDDHGHIAARWRLLAHFCAASWVLYWLGGMPPIPLFGGGMFEPGSIGLLFGALYLVWALNLYNFMDGIDGIASVEAICVCGGGALLYVLTGHDAAATVPLALAAAVAGFLVWNFPPARIFMGDAGSGFLGIVLATLSLQAGWISPVLFWSWIILLGVFVADATTTLLRRLARGDRVYEAHRSHAYQFAARRHGRHLPVTIGVAAINLCWLLPIACAVGLGALGALSGTVLAYAPLVGLALRYDAGRAEHEAR